MFRGPVARAGSSTLPLFHSCPLPSYLRVATAVACQECHLCARGEFGLCAANRWSRSRMSWVRVTTLVVQLFSAKQLPAAPWRQEDIAVHPSHYAMVFICFCFLFLFWWRRPNLIIKLNPFLSPPPPDVPHRGYRDYLLETAQEAVTIASTRIHK